jgi:NitT/TauT family transport system ATP-binding protein
MGRKMEDVIKLRDVWKSFGDEVVLAGIDLSAKAGEVIGIVGPNGSGKTTLLRMTAGLERPDHGIVEVKGKVGLVYQDDLLLPWKTLYDNISLGLKYRKIPSEEIRMKVYEMSKKFGMEEHLGKFPSQVSGGTARKVSIARTLVLEPDILLLDEPFTGLDMASRSTLKSSLKAVVKEKRVTVIMVSHVLEDLIDLVDKVYAFTPRPAKIVSVLDLKKERDFKRLGELLARLYFRSTKP